MEKILYKIKKISFYNKYHFIWIIYHFIINKINYHFTSIKFYYKFIRLNNKKKKEGAYKNKPRGTFTYLVNIKKLKHVGLKGHVCMTNFILKKIYTQYIICSIYFLNKRVVCHLLGQMLCRLLVYF